MPWVAAASILALVGIFVHRLLIVMNGVSDVAIALAPGNR